MLQRQQAGPDGNPYALFKFTGVVLMTVHFRLQKKGHPENPVTK